MAGSGASSIGTSLGLVPGLGLGPGLERDDAISPIYNEWHLRRAAPYLGGIESKLLTPNKIARINII